MQVSRILRQAVQSPTAVVMMNMGGPSTVPETGDFLLRLFSDGDLIPLPFQSTIAPIIARRRTPSIEKQYSDIGGGSPILRWTREQGRGMAGLLDELSPETAPHKPYVAFRYARPLTEECLDQLRRDGVKRAVAFTQYPQYSCSTTGSSLNELYRQIHDLPEGDPVKGIKWSLIDRWGAHPGFIDSVARRIEASLSEYTEEDRKKAIILFSAHSLPMSVVNRGDPYPPEVASTVSRVMDRLDNAYPYRLLWQSQVGPSPWLGPSTNKALEGLAKQGWKNAVLVPIAFTSDHIETLFELDLEYVKEAKEHGITGIKRAESLNDSPYFIKAIADIVASHLKENADTIKIPTQFGLRCPGCVNDVCQKQREYFSSFSHSS